MGQPVPTSNDQQSILQRASTPVARKCIFVVDDDPGVRESLVSVLTGEGYTAVPAGGGLQALALAVHDPPDLVLLDLNLPGQDGWDTFERLTTENPLLPIIVITGRPNQQTIALAAGVGALLEKPLDIPRLLRTVADLLAEPGQCRVARLTGRRAPLDYPGQSAQFRSINE
jgi:CheY-like chemotaxis protein